MCAETAENTSSGESCDDLAMQRKRLYVVLIIAAGCARPAPEMQSFERASGSAAMEAWRASGLPEPNKNRCDMSLWRIKLASDAEVPQLCVAASAERDAGCTSYGTTSNFFAWRDYPIVVITSRWHSEPGIIVHELMHALWHCSDMPDEAGLGNTDHRDPRVWEAAGGATSVQARALAILAAQSPPLLPR
jgi:hypothetical protein